MSILIIHLSIYVLDSARSTLVWITACVIITYVKPSSLASLGFEKNYELALLNEPLKDEEVTIYVLKWLSFDFNEISTLMGLSSDLNKNFQPFGWKVLRFPSKASMKDSSSMKLIWKDMIPLLTNDSSLMAHVANQAFNYNRSNYKKQGKRNF